MCQRLNTGESNNFYFGIFICIEPLKVSERDPPPPKKKESLPYFAHCHGFRDNMMGGPLLLPAHFSPRSPMGVRAGGGGKGGNCPPKFGQRSGGKFGQSNKKLVLCTFICVKFRADQPLCPPPFNQRDPIRPYVPLHSVFRTENQCVVCSDSL